MTFKVVTLRQAFLQFLERGEEQLGPGEWRKKDWGRRGLYFETRGLSNSNSISIKGHWLE